MNPTTSKHTKIDLNIGDQLTSVSCGHIISELLKFVVYQRFQIPYTYQWLKHLINQKKSHTELEETESFKSQKHFRTASAALENLDCILKSLQLEVNGPTLPEEICIMLGATPFACREVYRLLLPHLCHKTQCHSSIIANDQKIQRNVFRTLVTSEAHNSVFFDALPPTNMYVFLQKRVINNQELLVNRDNFSLSDGCLIPKNAKVVIIDFRSKTNDGLSCCNDFQVFQDKICDAMTGLHISDDDSTDLLENADLLEDAWEIKCTETSKWFQSSYVVKGFKDCIVNGNTITNTWL